MTATRERCYSTPELTRIAAVLLSLGLAACSTVGQSPQGPGDEDNGPNAGDGDGDGDGEGDGDGDGDDTLTPCRESALAAKETLTTYCASCHGPDSAGSGGFKTVLDVPDMIKSGKVIPDNADSSPLYGRLSSNSMPPADIEKRPSADDIASVRDWIACGAPDFNNVDNPGSSYAFMDINKRLRTLLDDVRSFENPTDRQRIRYIDLSSLSNAGYGSKQIDIYRESVSFLINSLSTGQNVVAPEAIDSDNLLYRIDLRDYNWDEDTWELLVEDYPYAVVYDQDSRLFPYDEVSSEQLREETGTDIPYIQADWFISHAARPPLYHDLLGLPATLGELEDQLGIDVDQNILDEQVARSAFKNAGPSQNHRMIERHELNGNQGAFWLSYDFADNVDERNLFANPLDFQEDGGELIFNLPNGMQAYLVVSNQGDRLDKAPNAVVQDPLSRDGAVENGLSCMNCHMIQGIIPKPDEMRDFILRTGDNAQEIADVLALYADRDVMQGYFDDDANLYRTARNAAGVKNLSETTIHTLDNTHLDVLSISDVASVLGVSQDDLERALDATPQAFPDEIVALRQVGGGVQRDALEDVFEDLLVGLGLGEPLNSQLDVIDDDEIDNDDDN